MCSTWALLAKNIKVNIHDENIYGEKYRYVPQLRSCDLLQPS